MLIDFYNSMLVIVPLVIIAKTLSYDLDNSHSENIVMQKAVRGYFFHGRCPDGVKCEKAKISMGDKSISIRGRKPFNSNTKEGENGVLEDLYEQLEEALQANTEQ